MRTLPEPLLTFDLFSAFMVINPAYKEPSENEREKTDDPDAFSRRRAVTEPLASLLRMLPYANYR